METTSELTSPPSDWKIVCRTDKETLVPAIVFTLFALGALWIPFTPTKHPSDLVPMWILGGAGFCGLGGFAVRLFASYFGFHITATIEGVRWRRFGPERFVRWEDITDYYYQLNRSRLPALTLRRREMLADTATLRTKDGEEIYFPQLERLFGPPSSTESFCAIVTEHATSAKAKEWEVLGTRSVDEWPQTFRYGMTAPLGSLLAMLCMPLLSGGFTYYLFASTWQKTLLTAKYMGWGLAIVPMLLFALLLVVPTLGLAFFAWPSMRDWLKSRHDRFVVTREELRYESPTETLVVSWNEVVDYFRKTSGLTHSRAGDFNRYVLVLAGRDERQIEFSDGLRNSHLLAHIIDRYAGKANEAEAWRTGSPQERRKRESRWKTEDGRLRFTYQGELGALILWMPGGIFIAMLISAGFKLAMKVESERIQDSLIVAGVVFVWWLYDFIVSRYAQIEIDDFGITQKSLFKTKRLLWLAVEDYKYTGFPDITVCGRDGTRIHIWSFLAGYKAVQEEIAKRAPAPLTGWKGRLGSNQ